VPQAVRVDFNGKGQVTAEALSAKKNVSARDD
jgi:hypothetical protein